MGASKKLTIRRFIVYLCSLFVLLLAKPHPVLYPIGICLVVPGELLRLWACGYLRKNQDVIMSGPFAHMKNPLYVGTCLILIGLCLAASHPDAPSKWVLYVALPLFMAIFVFYYFPKKVRVEGDRLRRRFGEKFDEYDRNVPNFFPRLTPYKPADGPQGLVWDPQLLKENSEWGTFYWVLAGSIIIFSKFFFDLGL